MNTYHRKFTALGSTIAFTLVSNDTSVKTDALLDQLQREVLRFEKRCSRFLADSELTQLNKKAGVQFWASDELRDILQKARDVAIKTGGLYNPFILPSLQRAGYQQSFLSAHSQDQVDIYTDRSVADAHDLEICDGWVRIPYGTAIDLGGCGKGYMGDVLAATVDDVPWVTGYWLSIGGDVIAKGAHETGEPVFINIRAETTDKSLAKVEVSKTSQTAVATSSVMKRKGLYNGKSWHHIVDPRTGKPANTDVLAASVLADTLLEADVHASNCIIVGSVEFKAYARDHRIRAAVIQLKNSDNLFFGDAISSLKA